MVCAGSGGGEVRGGSAGGGGAGGGTGGVRSGGALVVNLVGKAMLGTAR